MRHIRRTHRINLDWLYEIFECDEVGLRYVNTLQQVAHILTKHFSNSTTWLTLLNLVGLHAPRLSHPTDDTKSLCQGGPGPSTRISKCQGGPGPGKKTNACQGGPLHSKPKGHILYCSPFRSFGSRNTPKPRFATQCDMTATQAGKFVMLTQRHAGRVDGWTPRLQGAKLAAAVIRERRLRNWTRTRVPQRRQADSVR